MAAYSVNTVAAPGAAAVCAFAIVALQLGAPHAALAAQTTHTVIMEGVAVNPGTLTVAKGDTVVWVNKDPFPHTATAQDKSFDSKEIAAGKSWRLTVRKSGTFPYVCTLHPTMKGTLIVK
jgi:plastocyanin